jgi:aminoglycoside phosphotransferase (APT) family kinase protein
VTCKHPPTLVALSEIRNFLSALRLVRPAAPGQAQGMAIKNVLDARDVQRALGGWWKRDRPAAEDVVVGDVHVPQSSGMSSETIMFRVDWVEHGARRGIEAVARVIPPDGQVFPAYDFDFERRVMDAVRTSTGVPAPRVLAVEPDASVLGSPFLLMERLGGRVLADDPPFTVAGWLIEWTPADQATLYDNALVALAGVHRTDVGGFGPETLGHPGRPGGGPVAQHIGYWEALYAWGCGGRRHPTIDAAFAWAHANAPTVDRDAGLSWGDARLGNFLFDDRGAVTGVLDWEGAALGPPELDLGWFVFVNRMYAEGLGAPPPPGFPDRAQTIARYEELAGRDVRDFDFYEVLGGLRVATIVMRIGTMMIEMGLLPADAAMPISNPASNVLAALLDLPAPAAGHSDWITGNR